jgi:hypothetical protein
MPLTGLRVAIKVGATRNKKIVEPANLICNALAYSTTKFQAVSLNSGILFATF